MHVRFCNNIALISLIRLTYYFDVSRNSHHQNVSPVIFVLFIVAHFIQYLIKADIVVKRSRTHRRFQFKVVKCARDHAINAFTYQFALNIKMIAFVCYQHAHVLELFIRFGTHNSLLLDKHRVAFIWLRTYMSINIEIIFTQ